MHRVCHRNRSVVGPSFLFLCLFLFPLCDDEAAGQPIERERDRSCIQVSPTVLHVELQPKELCRWLLRMADRISSNDMSDLTLSGINYFSPFK